MYDVVIIGGGPAGLSAAIYLARANYKVLVVEKEKIGGQITITARIDNYPGITDVSGAELTMEMKKQAERFGAEFLMTEVTDIDMDEEIKKLTTDDGILECRGVLLATGAHPRKVGFIGEQEYKGRGVAYCATCDGRFFRDKEVFVIGGGYAAAQESEFLTQYARHVTIMMRGDDFSCARSIADKARSNPKITVLNNTEVVEVSGDDALRKMIYRNNKTGETKEYSVYKDEYFGVFVFAGYVPATEMVATIAELDERGYLITDINQRTSVDGLFGAGDVCRKKLRQVVTAVSDGAVAATELERYLSHKNNH